MEKKNIVVNAKNGPIDKKDITQQMKHDIKSQMGWLSAMLEHINKTEKEDDIDDKV